jgi:exopolysaccharide production protein ExoZ
MVPTPSKFHSIQVLRAIAATLVVLFHAHGAFLEIGGARSIPGEAYLFAFGAVGVHLFFVISGFIMVMTSKFDPAFSSREFMRRRLLRIYPVYWISASLYLAYHSTLGTGYGLSLTDAAGALLLVPGSAPKIIGPAWTLAYEMYFYLSFAAIMRLGLNRGVVTLGLLFAALIALGAAFRPQIAVFDVATNPLLMEFVAGMVIGWLVKMQRFPTSMGWVLALAGLGLFLASALYGYRRLPTVLSWGIPSALLVAGVVAIEIQRSANAAARLVGRLGDSSYSLYLLHVLLITIVVDLLLAFSPGRVPNAILASFAVVVFCVFVSELFHRQIEVPMLRALNGKRRSARLGGAAQPL